MKRWLALACALALTIEASFAWGAPTPSQRAEELYAEAKRLAAAGEHAAACPMFEESQKLEPAIGTQFNLADCLEVTGKRASALVLFREVIRVAQLSGRQERQKAATERAEALERTVGRVVVQVAADLPELRVRFDGVEVSKAAAQAGVASDGGEHVVRLEATGHVPWQAKVVLAGEASARAVVQAPALEPLEREVIRPVEVSGPPLRPLAIGLMGAGAVGLAIGTTFGVVAMNKTSDAGCDGTDCSKKTQGAADTLRDAQSAGVVSTIAFAAGGALAAGGLVLFFFGPKGTASSGRPLSLTASGDRVVLRGTF